MKTRLLLLSLLTLFLSGCASSVSFAEASTLPAVGFWYGLWHGLILPISWVFSLFNSDVAIYATYNNGGWYDFGFVLGVGSLGGGSSSSRK